MFFHHHDHLSSRAKGRDEMKGKPRTLLLLLLSVLLVSVLLLVQSVNVET